MRTAILSRRPQRPAKDPAGGGTSGPRASVLAERVFRIRESGIVVVLAVFVLVTTLVQPRFLDASNIQFILVDTTVFALLALGETMVVVTRNVDLSIGSVLGLSAYLSANLFSVSPGIPIPVVFLAGLGIGLGVRPGQRDPGGRRPGAEPGGDAGDALHHPRHRHPDRRRQGGRRGLAAAAPSCRYPRRRSSASPTSPSWSRW